MAESSGCSILRSRFCSGRRISSFPDVSLRVSVLICDSGVAGDRLLTVCKLSDTGWERVPVSPVAKKVIWRLEADRYALTSPNLYELGRDIPGYYLGEDPENMSFGIMESLRAEAWDRFSNLSLFFVKASELMYLIPTIPHLHNVKLTMAYRELPDDSQALRWNLPQKWKSDPDSHRSNGFAPRNKYFLNGALVGEDKPRLAQVSKTPFPETRVPRRGGLVAVSPDEPDYARLCAEQGLHHLLVDKHSPALPNGLHPADVPATLTANRHAFTANSLHAPLQQNTPAVNGSGYRHTTDPPTPLSQGPQPLVNGVNGVNGIVNGDPCQHAMP
jgi:hypothetical protein